MGGLLHPARHKTIVSGVLGVFSVSLGRGGLQCLPRERHFWFSFRLLLAMNAPAHAPEPIPREKPKNHKTFVSGVLRVLSAFLGRGMVALLPLFCCWRMCRRRGGSRAARTCTRAGPGAASKSRRRYNVAFDVSGVLPLDHAQDTHTYTHARTHTHSHARAHAHAHA
jgi:hypothetical protein